MKKVLLIVLSVLLCIASTTARADDPRCEVGDPIYRDGVGIGWYVAIAGGLLEPLLSGIGIVLGVWQAIYLEDGIDAWHTGLLWCYSEHPEFGVTEYWVIHSMDNANSEYATEGEGPQYGTFDDDFLTDTYKNARRYSGITPAQRQFVIDYAMEQIDEGVTYAHPPIDFFFSYKSSGNSFRCDGLVEYAYEQAGLNIVTADSGITLTPYFQAEYGNLLETGDGNWAEPPSASHTYDPQPTGNIGINYSERMSGSTFSPVSSRLVLKVNGASTSYSPSWHGSPQEPTGVTIDPTSTLPYGAHVQVYANKYAIRDLAGNRWSSNSSDTSAVIVDYYVSEAPAHVISASDGSNGDIEPEGSVTVSHGSTRTFTATPSSGYEVDKWYWDGSSQQTGGTLYTTPVIYGNHTLHVTFKEESPDDIDVTSPVAGFSYYQNSIAQVAWVYYPGMGTWVQIDLYRNGSFVETIDDSESASGRDYQWTVPDDVPLGGGYQVKVTALATGAEGFSGTFSIAEEPDDDTVIEIKTLAQLQAVGRYGYYKLMNDIDADGYDFQPLGGFSGTFDGNGFRIMDLEITKLTEENVGLFRFTYNSAVIRDLTIDDGYIRGRHCAGAICGEFSGLMINCHSSARVRGNIDDPSNMIGGLVGENSGTIRNCSTYGPEEVRGYGDEVGGIAGWNFTSGVIEYSWSTIGYVIQRDDGGETVYNSGGVAGWNEGLIRQCYTDNLNVDVDDYYSGGIAGRNEGTINNCYSLSKTSGGDYPGGLAGNDEGGVISNCFAAGLVNDPTGGGLFGQLRGGQVMNCLWDTQTTGKSEPYYNHYGGTLTDCYGKTTAEMQQQATFQNLGWNFGEIWSIEEGVSYPTLRAAKPHPAAPTGISASSDRTDGVFVSWSAVPNAGCYMVFRADSSDGNPQPVSGWVTGTSHLDTTAIEEVTHYYWVKAALTTQGVGQSDFSSYATGIRLLGPVPAPASIAASDNGLNAVVVEWDSVPSAGFYKLYRAGSEDGAKTGVTAWITDTSHSDTPAVARQNYYYWVKAAADATGTRESDFCGPDTGYFRPADSNAPSVWVSCSPVAPIETQDVQIDVSASDNDMLRDVTLHWEIPGMNTQTWASVDSNAFDTCHSIGGFGPGVEVLYWAECWDHAGNRAETEHKSLVIQAESVSVPFTPAGPGIVYLNEPSTFVASGSSSTLDCPVEYQFDWSDGQTSTWASVGMSHSWPIEGYMSVRTRARSQPRPGNMSGWSGARIVHVRDWNKDYDSDGMTDAQEATAGTDPSSGLSCLQFGEVLPGVTSNSLVLRWSSASNRFYHLKMNEDLNTGFGEHSVSNLEATPPVNTLTVSVDQALMFFRIYVTTNRLGQATPILYDGFSDNSIDATLWFTEEAWGGQVLETDQQIQVWGHTGGWTGLGRARTLVQSALWTFDLVEAFQDGGPAGQGWHIYLYDSSDASRIEVANNVSAGGVPNFNDSTGAYELRILAAQDQIEVLFNGSVRRTLSANGKTALALEFVSNNVYGSGNHSHVFVDNVYRE